jgi:hypothetical protein
VADLQHKNDESLILYSANEVIVANAIAPKPSEIHPKRLAKLSGIGRPGDSLAQIAQDIFLGFTIELTKFASGTIVKFNGPYRLGLPRPGGGHT